MKNIKLLAIVAMMVSATSLFAEETVSVRRLVCNPTAAVESWTFTNSGNVANGEEDRQGYLVIRFAATQLNGSSVQSTHTVEVKGLEWDKKMKQLLFKTADYTVRCAKKSWLGVKVYNKDCSFKGEFGPATSSELESCDSKVGSVFTGTFTVK